MSFFFIKILILFKLCIYLVLNNAHNATFSISVWMKNQIHESMANFFILNKGDLGNELQVLHIWMVEEVMAIFLLFFSFVSLYFVYKVQNMITFMLELQFKLPLMCKVLNMVAKHNNKTFIPLLMVTFCFLNLEATSQKLNL